MMTIDFIGRGDELRRMEDLCGNGGIVRVSGRHGVGKTAFVSRFCRDRPHTMFSCRSTGRRSNLRALSEIAGTEVRSVQEAIDALYTMVNGGLVVLDNCCRIDGCERIVPNEGQTVILVDRTMSDADIVLEPFDLRVSGDFFPDCMPRERLLIYAVTGGVPGYMTMFDRNVSVSDNIESLFFRENGRLHSEPERLLRAMGIREPDGYLSVLTAMSEGSDTVNGIMRCSDDNSTAAVLKHLGPLMGILVERHVPDGLTRASYRIRDNMIRFWLRFVQPRADSIASGEGDLFADIPDEEIDGYLSTVYREVCSQYMEDGYGCRIETWKASENGDTSFAQHSDGDSAHFVSCTWSKRPVGTETLRLLTEHAGRRCPGKERTYVMFSSGGFRRDLEQMSEESDIDLVPLEGMFW